MKKSLNKYQNYLNKIPSYYNMLNNKYEETIDQISLSIKKSILYDKIFTFHPNDFQLHTIHDVIDILKIMNLNL